jgi:hypothetical protein
LLINTLLSNTAPSSTGSAPNSQLTFGTGGVVFSPPLPSSLVGVPLSSTTGAAPLPGFSSGGLVADGTPKAPRERSDAVAVAGSGALALDGELVALLEQLPAAESVDTSEQEKARHVTRTTPVSYLPKYASST